MYRKQRAAVCNQRDAHYQDAIDTSMQGIPIGSSVPSSFYVATVCLQQTLY